MCLTFTTNEKTIYKSYERVTRFVNYLYFNDCKTIVKEIATNFNELLSPLERDVLKILWPDKKLKVRQIFESLKSRRKVALSSVAVILDRLHNKGVVERTIETARGGMRYTYFPKKDKKQFEKSIVDSAVNKLIDAFGPTAVTYFNERFGKKR